MITLTQEQLQPIQERLLNKYDLKYDEIREELLDHIACEIEDLMNQGESYEEATILVFRKWNVRLISNEKGWYKGIPHFVLNQIGTEYKKVEIISIFVAMLLAVPLFFAILYWELNSLLLMISLFVLQAIGVGIIYKESKGLQEYRFDFLRKKAGISLLNAGIALAFSPLLAVLCNIEVRTSEINLLVMYYFIFSSILLFRFWKYCKHQQFKIAK
ncbi:hypothetical protein [Myroides sp. WP-1]|uniref:hypothetical protein n=1 Tax=Myroides sp. WP-1 TaxID=2759944 RepID=UPI0015F7F727|nr:hypothetical protein [Myroides sp. WP-1]MBB1139462.1 hypothetical protein [Myroides sp. WP-1]